MRKVFVLIGCLCSALVMTGCSTVGKNVVKSASGKNLTLDGSVMYGVVETANNETATPQGKMIIGRLSYKSRVVGIPEGSTVPNTGYFKSTQTKNLFGTEEQIVEYDFTASDAKTALKMQEQIHRGIPVEQSK